MLDFLFYRDIVIETISDGQHIEREVYELRFDLFLRAADCFFNGGQRISEILEPFPSCFYDVLTKTRQYDDLKSCISVIPRLCEINDKTSLPERGWELLHWIFTNPLDISVIRKSEISQYLTDELRHETRLFNIPYPSSTCNRFEIVHPGHPSKMNATNIFLKHKSKFGSFYAFHGSPGRNFHSIIHRGLRCSLSVRRAHGPGTYLTTCIQTAETYARQFRDYQISRELERIRLCIAIVEVVKHPSIKIVDWSANRALIPLNPVEPPVAPDFNDMSSNHNRYYVVNSDELMRLKHLIVYY